MFLYCAVVLILTVRDNAAGSSSDSETTLITAHTKHDSARIEKGEIARLIHMVQEDEEGEKNSRSNENSHSHENSHKGGENFHNKEKNKDGAENKKYTRLWTSERLDLDYLNIEKLRGALKSNNQRVLKTVAKNYQLQAGPGDSIRVHYIKNPQEIEKYKQNILRHASTSSDTDDDDEDEDTSDLYDMKIERFIRRNAAFRLARPDNPFSRDNLKFKLRNGDRAEIDNNEYKKRSKDRDAIEKEKILVTFKDNKKDDYKKDSYKDKPTKKDDWDVIAKNALWKDKGIDTYKKDKYNDDYKTDYKKKDNVEDYKKGNNYDYKKSKYNDDYDRGWDDKASKSKSQALRNDWEKSKSNDWDKPKRNDWDQPKSDRDKQKLNDWDKPKSNDWDKPKSNDWEKSKSNDWDKPKSNDWDTPKSNDRDIPKSHDLYKPKSNDWDKQNKDSWSNWKPKSVENIDKKRDSKNWDKPMKKDDWDTPKKPTKGIASYEKDIKSDYDYKKEHSKKTTSEWDRAVAHRGSENSNPVPFVPKISSYYNPRPKARESPERGGGGIKAFGRTSIPFVGKKGIYDDK